MAPLHPAPWVWGFFPHIGAAVPPQPPCYPRPHQGSRKPGQPALGGAVLRVRPEGLAGTGSGRWRWRVSAEPPPRQAPGPVLPAFCGRLVLDSSRVPVPSPGGGVCRSRRSGAHLLSCPEHVAWLVLASPVDFFLKVTGSGTCQGRRRPLRGLLWPLRLCSCSPCPAVVCLPRAGRPRFVLGAEHAARPVGTLWRRMRRSPEEAGAGAGHSASWRARAGRELEAVLRAPGLPRLRLARSRHFSSVG